VKPYSIIFCGTPEFAVPSLKALAESPQFCIKAVITQPDRPVGRKQQLTPPIIKNVAEEYSIPVLQPEKLLYEHIANIPCDFLIVVAYGQILSKSVLQHPKIAPINVHASLLPRWRGASPIQTSIAYGDLETGVTIQHMVHAMDAGDILAQARVPITQNTTSIELFSSLAELGARTLKETLLHPLTKRIQNEQEATYCTKLDRNDGCIDHTIVDAQTIERLHRAYYPWPGITLTIASTAVKIHSCSLVEQSNSVKLHCANTTILYIQTVQIAGKNQQAAQAVWRALEM
jgi:methionyl-tRNA formyltransferase